MAEDLQNEYHIVSFSVTEELNIMDVEAIDILMVIYLQLINSIKTYEIKDKQSWDERILTPLKRLIPNNLQIKEAEAGVSLLKSVSFKIKVEPESRDAIRKGFKKQLERLQQNISAVCKEIIRLTKKDVLIIIDDLDKLQDEETCKRIFFKETHLLAMPESKIIFTFPLFAYYSPAFRHISDQFTYKFIQLVNLHDIDGNYQESSMTILNKLVLKRIEQKHVSDKAMKYLIDKSGGLLRDLIHFMQDACKIVIDKEESEINDEIVQKVVQDKINEYNRIFDFPEYKDKVKQIMQTKNKEAIANKWDTAKVKQIFGILHKTAKVVNIFSICSATKFCRVGGV